MSSVFESVKSVRRQFVRSPLLTLLNILGLAAGCATGAVIFLYAKAELNYDSWVPDRDRLYVVEGRFLQSASGGYTTATMAPLQPAIEAEIDETVESARLRPVRMPVQRGDFTDYEIVTIADQDFLTIFPLDYLDGDPATVWSTANSVILSDSLAIKYFGATDVVGEVLTIDGDTDYRVTGVFAELPERTDVFADMVIEAHVGLFAEPESWSSVSMLTFVKLDSPASADIVTDKLAQLVETHRPFLGSAEGAMDEYFKLNLQPFDDYHLGSRGRSASNPIGNYAAMYGYIAIAILILLISAFNYVGLATAQALEREKEICLRQVMVANYGLIAKFTIAESAVQAAAAALLGLLLVEIGIPFFNAAMNYDLTIGELLRPGPLMVYLSGAVLLGAGAGAYPAFFVAGFRPVRFLSGGRSSRARVAKIRQALVFLQFTAAIGLIIGAVTISRQIAFTLKVDLGFDQENLLVLRGLSRDEVRPSSSTLRDRVIDLPGVVAVTRSSVVPMDNDAWTEAFYSEQVTREEAIGLRIVSVDYDFWETYEVPLVAGRALDERFSEDLFLLDAYTASSETPANRNIVLNEPAIRELGFSNATEAVGQPIQLFKEDGGSQSLTIVGVIRDMIFESARQEEESKLFFHDPDQFSSLTARIDPRYTEVQAQIGSLWREAYPATPARIDVLEDRIARKYAGERQQLDLFIVFATLAILLSVVGLVGLIMNSVARRVKEISLRKVLGASSLQVMHLFAWQYLKPVLIANLPASALAFYYVNDWLQQYAARIDITLSTYVLSGAEVALVALAIVTVLVIRFAQISPVLALRHE